MILVACTSKALLDRSLKLLHQRAMKTLRASISGNRRLRRIEGGDRISVAEVAVIRKSGRSLNRDALFALWISWVYSRAFVVKLSGMRYTYLVSALLLIFTFPATIQADTTSFVIEQPHIPSLSTSSEIRDVLAARIGSTSPMMDVVRCESHFRQFNDSGAILTHFNDNHTFDIGIFQINSRWLDTARDLGFDINTPIGNIDMGLWILKKYHISQWVCAAKLGII